MPYITVGDSDLYYEEYGQGYPIVLLHGVGGNHASWYHQVHAWGNQYRIIVPDARGFGNSNDIEGLGRSAFVADLLALLDVLNIDSVVIVGQSMGGGTAAVFACQYPDRVDGVVLADTLFSLVLPEEIRESMRELSARTSKLSQLQRVLGAEFRATHPEMAMLYSMLASFNATNVHNLRGQQDPIALEDLAGSNVPVLYLVGEDDILFPAEAVRVVHEHTPGSTFEIVPKAGHSPYFERAKDFNERVEAWLDTLPIHTTIK